MRPCTQRAFVVSFAALSQLLLTCEGQSLSDQFQATYMSHDTICQDGFMSALLSKIQFADLPLTLYVQDELGGYYQLVSLAQRCHYFLGETDTSIILTVAFQGCFVRRQNHVRSLPVAIVARTDTVGVEVVESILLVCESSLEVFSTGEHLYSPALRPYFCNEDGFSIVLNRNSTVPPLNLDAARIPSSEHHSCKPRKISADAVIFSFPFTDCGAQSVIEDGILTYWVQIVVEQHPHKSSVLRDTPLQLILRCSFVLSKVTQLAVEVQRDASEHPSVVAGQGAIRARMRFAKDSSYRSFYSSRDLPAVTELGQLVYVEVFVLKHQDKDLVLLLDDCWATPTGDPHDPQRWNLLVKGCPFTGDGHRTVVLPVATSRGRKYPSLHRWFVVKLFSFVKPPTSGSLVYFHCDLEICKQGCSQLCDNGSHKSRRIPWRRQTVQRSVVSGGPLPLLS